MIGLLGELLATVCSNLSVCKEADWGLGIGASLGVLTAGRSQANPEELSELGQPCVGSLQLMN